MKHLYLSALVLAMAASTSWAIDAKKPHKAVARVQASAVGQVWDWSKIDTNKDNLIEPEEMEAWLKANPGVQKG